MAQMMERKHAKVEGKQEVEANNNSNNNNNPHKKKKKKKKKKKDGRRQKRIFKLQIEGIQRSKNRFRDQY